MKHTFHVFSSLSVVMLIAAAASAQVTPQKPGSAPVGTSGSATAASPRPSSFADTSTDYRLVAGDKLRIEVYKDPQLSQSLQIRPDGKITLPLVGDVPAAGRTSAELREAITTSLRQFNENPALKDMVTVIVVETVPQVIYVMGEVNNPGPQPITAQMTVLQALATAGGFKDFANTKDIRILRKSTSGLTTTLHFNYKDAIKGLAKAVLLQPGDTVIVP